MWITLGQPENVFGIGDAAVFVFRLHLTVKVIP